MRVLKIALLIVSGLFLFSNPVLSLTIDGTTDVGDIDTMIASDFVANDYDSELAWVQSVLGSEFFFADSDKMDTETLWTVTDQLSTAYALELSSEPSHYFIKIGLGGTSLVDDHFLYQNDPLTLFAVVSELDWTGGNDIQNIDVFRISHLAPIGGTSVPEPSTILLLGLGLVGIAGIGRKKVKR